MLLILAVVSISALVGDNGILDNATEAVEQTGIAGAQEAFEIALAGAQTDYYEAVISGETTKSQSNYITIGMIREGLGNSYQYCSKYSSAENTDDDDKTLAEILEYESNYGIIYLSKKGSEDGSTIYAITYEVTYYDSSSSSDSSSSGSSSSGSDSITSVDAEIAETLDYVIGADEETEDEDTGVITTALIFVLSEDDWTNEDVVVTIQANGEAAELVSDGTYTIQYTLGNPLNEDEWIEYTDGVTLSENSKVFARLHNGNNGGDFSVESVTNIDKTAPVITGIAIGITNITITATDEASGIVGYYVSTSLDEPSESDFVDCSEDGSGVTSLEQTIEDLEQWTEYYVWVIDDAGNISEVKSVTTSGIPGLSSDNVEYTLSEDDWTNEDVTVTIEITDEEIQEKIDDGTYDIEYSTDGGETWEIYDEEAGITVDENTEIKVRVTDGENTGDVILIEVANIDKTAPTIGEVTATTNSVTITGEDDSSGIVGYYISTDSTTPTEDGFTDCRDSSGNGVTSLEKTITGLTQDTTYYIWIIDDSGNMSEMAEITTDAVDDLYSGEELGLEVAIGDYVDYPIDINENGDTTDDWRVWYINDDGVVFLITAEYVPNDSEYLDTTDEDGDGVYDATEMTPSEDSVYNLYWYNWWTVPDKQWTDLMSETTNSLFMFNYSYGSSSTYGNMLAVSTLLNTENWDGFVYETYADYAIGGSTLEMWVASWNELYGDKNMIYCNNESSYGYYIGTSDSPTSTGITQNAMSATQGYQNTLYFPYTTEQFEEENR